jgi:hypothetical protein
MPNFMKILPVKAELFHVGGQADRHDKANIQYSELWNAPENTLINMSAN